jgi:hypothetical protein
MPKSRSNNPNKNQKPSPSPNAKYSGEFKDFGKSWDSAPKPRQTRAEGIAATQNSSSLSFLSGKAHYKRTPPAERQGEGHGVSKRDRVNAAAKAHKKAQKKLSRRFKPMDIQ